MLSHMREWDQKNNKPVRDVIERGPQRGKPKVKEMTNTIRKFSQSYKTQSTVKVHKDDFTVFSMTFWTF